MSDILRKMADIMDCENDSQAEPELLDVTTTTPDLTPDDDDITDNNTMVPPLQQKHELLKKAAGVNNNTDQCEQPDTEMNMLKRLAGLLTSQKENLTSALIHLGRYDFDAESIQCRHAGFNRSICDIRI